MIPMFGSRRRPVMQRPQNRPAPQARPAPQPMHTNHTLVMTTRKTANKQPLPKNNKAKPKGMINMHSLKDVVRVLG